MKCRELLLGICISVLQKTAVRGMFRDLFAVAEADVETKAA